MAAKYRNAYALRTNRDGNKIAYEEVWAQVLTQEEFNGLLYVNSEDYKYYYDRYSDALHLEGIVDMKVNDPIKHSFYFNSAA